LAKSKTRREARTRRRCLVCQRSTWKAMKAGREWLTNQGIKKVLSEQERAGRRRRNIRRCWPEASSCSRQALEERFHLFLLVPKTDP